MLGIRNSMARFLEEGKRRIQLEESTIENYASRPEAFNTPFLNIDKLRSAFKADEFLNWHALFESIKRKLPFLNWDAFPKLKGLRSATPDAQ
ncbi:PREDICTED: keratinocyte differentiation-associated protein isoform X3 [Rhinopithecus bieti]|uniref:keratinocyte differentiation-associated protein isoform X3 n=1 Tax=Rhinopithecus bieti TaxID=61621 RepID=UPI00083C04A9|nr:PREDICTED: keratinocyte differentiation-associated protein isoform X3 [Rhinopithecus bieti]